VGKCLLIVVALIAGLRLGGFFLAKKYYDGSIFCVVTKKIHLSTKKDYIYGSYAAKWAKKKLI